MSGLTRRLRIAAMPAVALATILAVALGSGPATASNLGHRPGASAAGSVAAPAASTAGFTPFSSTMQNTSFFCDNPADPPCDGNAGAGDFGTADSVPHQFSNYGFGNYAPGGVPALPNGTSTLAKVAVLAGTTAANQHLGCQTPGTEGCTGPYIEDKTRPQYGFPSTGYTVTSYQYLDPGYSAPDNAQIDTDLGINQVAGTSASYGQDEVISACNDSGGTSLSFGHGSPGACGSGDQVTSAGWYRFVFLVTNVGGDVFVTAKVLTEDGSTLLFNSHAQPVSFDGGVTQATTSDTGGLRYLWWPTLDVTGLRVGFVGYKAGQLQSGQAS